jgi:hypothetical protein
MTLPYPYEVELGLMKPRPWVARTPFDVAHHLEQAIQVRGEKQLMVFGTALLAPAPAGATATAKQFSDSLSARFHAWRPGADAATWKLFESQARAEMAGLERADQETLRILMLTVSGL